MRYLGGKTRQAKWLLEHSQTLRGSRSCYLEPFVGGGSVLAAVAPHFSRVRAGDVVPELIMLHQACQYGWVPPVEMSRDEYNELKLAPPSAMKAWAGFAASYNGKYFAGYGPRAAGRDYSDEASRGMVRRAENYLGVEFQCCPYDQHVITSDDVVYCDPPYANTENYAAAGEFNHAAFWSWADRVHEVGALVLVTEFTAPKHWVPVDSVERVQTLDKNSSNTRREMLYTRPR